MSPDSMVAFAAERGLIWLSPPANPPNSDTPRRTTKLAERSLVDVGRYVPLATQICVQGVKFSAVCRSGNASIQLVPFGTTLVAAASTKHACDTATDPMSQAAGACGRARSRWS